MRFRHQFALACGLLFAATAHADMTLRWKVDFRPAEGLPGPIAQAMAAQPAVKAMEVVGLLRGDLTSFEQGPIRAISDRRTGTITVIHLESKRVASGPIADYPPKIDAFANLPPEAKQALEKMEVDVSTSKPGRFDSVRGVQCEETELRLSIKMPMPAPMPPMEMRLQMSNWSPVAGEVARVPALKQAVLLADQAKGSMDVSNMMARTFGSFPGMGEKLKKAMTDLMNNSSSLSTRMRMRFAMPSLAAQLKGSGMELPPGFDGTIGDLTMELTEMSEAPVPESAFGLPSGYEKVSMEELFKGMAAPKRH